MSIPVLLVILEIWSTRSSPWTSSCSWQSSSWRPPPTWPLTSCYHCHYTQWSPQKNGIKIRAFVAELLHLKERGQKCDIQTYIQTDRHTHLLLRPLKERGQKCDRQTDRHTYIHTYTHTHLLLRPLPYGRGLKKLNKFWHVPSKNGTCTCPCARGARGMLSTT